MPERISLLQELKKGGYEASLITTYNAYLPFYENVLLRKLASCGVRHNVVLIDAAQCSQSISNYPPRFAGRNYSLVPMYSKGAFHPKVILLVGKNKGALFVGSHNLTLSGFGFNRELTNMVHMQNKDDIDAISVLNNAWLQIKGWMADQQDRMPEHIHEMVDNVKNFGPWLNTKEALTQNESCFVISSQNGMPSLWEQLRELITEKVQRVIVSGAFFDSNYEFIKRVKNDLSPEEFYIGVEPNTVQIPVDLRNYEEAQIVNSAKIGNKDPKSQTGYLHAKSLVIETISGETYLVSGSANPSWPAWLGQGLSSNTEMMLVRKGDEAAIDALENGLLDIPTMPLLSNAEWEIAQENWETKKETQETSSKLMGIALAIDEGIKFEKLSFGNNHSIECKVLDHNKALLEKKPAYKQNENYLIALSNEIKDRACYVEIITASKNIGYFLVHHEKIIIEQSRTGTQRRFREAMTSLNTGSPDLVTLISCVDKIIFEKSQSIDVAASTKNKSQKQSDKQEEGGESGASLSVDVSDTKKSKKKFRFRQSDDLSFLFNTLIYHLKIENDFERPIEIVDSKGRSEEEQVGEDDDITTEEETTEEEEARKSLELCNSKVKTLIRRMSTQLDALNENKVNINDIIVRLTGVLALLRHLRSCDGKVPWIKPGQTSFPIAERNYLFESIVKNIFEGEYSIIYPRKELLEIKEADELARLKGLILWLAWDCGLSLNLKQPFFEKPEDKQLRFENNAKLIALLQIIQDDEIVVLEAKNSIAQFIGSDLDWLDWVLISSEKISALSSGESLMSPDSKAKTGDLAFNLNKPELGIRMIRNTDSQTTHLFCFAPKKDCISYVKESIQIAPIESILH